MVGEAHLLSGPFSEYMVLHQGYNVGRWDPRGLVAFIMTTSEPLKASSALIVKPQIVVKLATEDRGQYAAHHVTLLLSHCAETPFFLFGITELF